MRRIVLLCGHVHSGVEEVRTALCLQPRFDYVALASRRPYTSAYSLVELLRQRHKLNTRAAVFVDQSLNNVEITTDAVFEHARMVYFVREPRPVLGQMVLDGIKPDKACLHYLYRLRRLAEMAKRTPSGFLVTSLEHDLEPLAAFLGCGPLRVSTPETKEAELPLPLAEKAEHAYEKYLYFLKSLRLGGTS